MHFGVCGNLKITGPDADLEKLRAYVTTTLRRAEAAAVEKDLPVALALMRRLAGLAESPRGPLTRT